MKTFLNFFSFLLFVLMFNGCEAIGDIFKAGVWIGVIIVIAIIAVVAFLVKLFKK